MRKSITFYQGVKIKWRKVLINRRKSTDETIKITKDQINRRKFIIANLVKNTSKLDAIERKQKNAKELFHKTEKIRIRRNQLRTSYEMQRKDAISVLHNKRIYSSMH